MTVPKVRDDSHVCVVGGGINGLSAALYLVKQRVRVTLVEADDRLGGQIKTTDITEGDISYSIEEGAEGYVARSELFPELADLVGIKSEIVKQEVVSDYELSSEMKLTKLEPGEAAAKLGFQVPKEDTGKGVHSFRNGMSQLVTSLERYLSNQACFTLILGHKVISVTDHGNFSSLTTSPFSEIYADFVIFSIFPEIAIPLVFPLASFSRRKFNSHVSIHALVPEGDLEISSPKSFTVSSDFQVQFEGLRAVSFVNEKFPTRVPSGFWLFRFYFRPFSEISKMEEISRDILRKLYKFHSAPKLTVSQWDSALPEFSVDFSEFQGKSRNFIFSVASGAGLEAAASAGKKSANKILELLGE